MSAIVILFVLSIVFYLMYLRYFPIKGVPCIDLGKTELLQPHVKVDIRDYNVSAKQKVNGSIEMPIAYIKRYHHEIPSKEIHLIAADKMEKNLGIRYLQNKGYRVVGYSLTNCKCKG
ncbi:sulfurtransferase [Aquibacillus salsiterrae]|uniref:Sulfurtransferase n=1 Tax=Aquibacillus salsiterrae TaxID=2950439 RepID=A0A9X3WIJ6_9BACI|nr:sulfurtransferase [Aquibacillus salsiterrae]MDC3417691.1 sulfurtransferase [Aquibacillus salsiterrae]